MFFLKTLSTTVLALEAMPITILAYYYQLHLKESFDKKKTDHESLDVWRLEEILVSGIESILGSLLMNFLQMSNVSKINWYLHSKSKSSNCLTMRILKLYITMCHLGKDFYYCLYKEAISLINLCCCWFDFILMSYIMFMCALYSLL